MFLKLLIFTFTSFDYVLIPYSVNEALIRDIVTSSSNTDISNLFFRPVFYENSDKMRLLGGYTDYFIDTRLSFFAFSYKKFKTGIIYFDAGKVETYDSLGFKTGEVSPTHLGAVLYIPTGEFFRFWNLKRGVSLKIFYLKLYKLSSLAIGFDISHLKEFHIKEKEVMLSIDIRNLGYSFNKNVSLPPYEINLSTSTGLGNFYMGTGLSYEPSLFSLRVSVLYKLNRYIEFALNYNTKRNELKESEGLHKLLTGLGIGVIIRVKNLNLYYAFIPAGIFGDIYKIDIGISF